jgi:hypothetical protein
MTLTAQEFSSQAECLLRSAAFFRVPEDIRKRFPKETDGFDGNCKRDGNGSSDSEGGESGSGKVGNTAPCCTQTKKGLGE